MIHSKDVADLPTRGDRPSEFLPYQLWSVVYWTTEAATGDVEFGFDYGEDA